MKRFLTLISILTFVGCTATTVPKTTNTRTDEKGIIYKTYDNGKEGIEIPIKSGIYQRKDGNSGKVEGFLGIDPKTKKGIFSIKEDGVSRSFEGHLTTTVVYEDQTAVNVESVVVVGTINTDIYNLIMSSSGKVEVNMEDKLGKISFILDTSVKK